MELHWNGEDRIKASVRRGAAEWGREPGCEMLPWKRDGVAPWGWGDGQCALQEWDWGPSVGVF